MSVKNERIYDLDSWVQSTIILRIARLSATFVASNWHVASNYNPKTQVETTSEPGIDPLMGMMLIDILQQYFKQTGSQ